MMMAVRWVPSGENWMWTTWVGDTQVIYLLVRDTTLTARGQWLIRKKVSGAAKPNGTIVGIQADLEKAKQVAEHDAEQPL